MDVTASGGQLSGTYWSAVGNVQYRYDLSGRYNATPASGGQSVAWAVAWTNAYGTANSSTGWSGQYQIDENGDEEIYTLWLLVSEMPPKNDWAATNVGQVTFSRSQPAQETIAKARRRRAASYAPSQLKA